MQKMENQLSKLQQEEVGTLKFKDFSDENPATELLRFIDGLCFKLSLPPLDEGQVIYIAKFLVSEFKWATMDDIDNAILKAKAGKLKELNSSDYNKLSIDYLGRVLNAYRLFKADLIASKRVSAPIVPNSLEYDGNSPQIAFKHIKDVFQSEQGGLNAFPDIMLADWTMCYDYLINEGKMQEQSLQDKLEFAEIVREDLKQELIDNRTDERSISFKLKMDKGLSKYAVASECIRRLVKAWFLTNIDKL